MPSTSALVKAPLFHKPLSTEDSLLVEEAKATMPPFSVAATVLTSALTSTSDGLAAPPAWQVSRNHTTLPGAPFSARRTSSCDRPRLWALSGVASAGRNQ